MYWTHLRLRTITENDFPIVGAQPTDPFILKGVDGLGPAPVSVYKTKTRHQPSVYQNREPEDKQLVATFGLNPEWSTGQTVSDLRDMLYDLLYGETADAPIDICIMDKTDVGDPIQLMTTIGWASKFEPNLFSKDPEVQITIECLGPYFHYGDPDGVSLDVGELDEEFPTIVNVGNAPTGFYARLVFTEDVIDWIINDGSSEHLAGHFPKKMQFDYSFEEDDVFEFSTVAGDRWAKVTRGVTEINLLSKLSTDSEWFDIVNGSQTWHVLHPGFDWQEFTYHPVYWGV